MVFDAAGKVVPGRKRVPVGGIRYQEEKQGDFRGHEGKAKTAAEKEAQREEARKKRAEFEASDQYFADLLKAHPARKVPGSRKKRGGKISTHTEAKAALAEAYANTPVLPTVKRYPPGP
ncbi:hypothetical protein AB4144_55900, partial [Rhizobiaceae sp. 2RAB30]